MRCVRVSQPFVLPLSVTSGQPWRSPRDVAEEEWLQVHRRGGQTWGERLSVLLYSACGVMSCSTPLHVLSWVLSAVQGENLEPIAVTAVCLRTAVVDLLRVSVKNLIFGNTLL